MGSDDQPVTVDVIQRVKPNCEAEFEQVLADLIQAAESFEGHLGVNIFRPSDHANPEYRIVFKFDRLSHLRQWETAPIRRRLLERASRLTVGSGQFQILTGLETWFTLPTQGAIVPPPRYKMLLVSLLVIFPLVNLLNFVLQPPLRLLPPLLRSLIVTIIMLSLTTYVVMPRVTKLLSGWLYPKPKV
jgi:antibiotic biosynthesis monooxygenase (ABM) superfamily enzyme